jgi:predicted deacetylase
MLAVVPDNRDPKLVAGEVADDFWDRVRGWQSRGWTIGWHGYQHLYSTPSGGIMDIHAGSEFAGHTVEVQRGKLAAAARIFEEQRVKPTVWIAPGHSFDATTARLLPEFGVHVISDGFFWRVVQRHGCKWVPQQLWRFRSLPFGTWTVCMHMNGWTERAVESFGHQLAVYESAITHLDAVLTQSAPTIGVTERTFESAWRVAVRLKSARAEH